jgi:hypothetical protein
MNRLLAVARLHTVTWQGPVVWPWLICGLAFLVNWAAFASMVDASDGEVTTGGLASLFVVSLVMFTSAVAQVFPYALGLGVSRRLFYTATALLAVAVSVADAVLLSALLLAENATGGWWTGLRFFGAAGDGPGQIFVYGVLVLLATFVGIFVGVVYVRWRINGALTLTAAAIVVPGGLVALASWRGWWGEIGSWLADQSPLSLYAGWPLLLVAAAALAGLAVVRRATA